MASAPVDLQSIPNSWYHRAITLMAIELCKCWRPRSGCVLFLSSKICVKYGTFQQLSEAATMQFIANHTKMPVPKVYCAFSRKDRTYIVMERIDGKYICDGWYHRSQQSRESILLQIRAMVAKMRSIEPLYDTGVASATGGELYDMRLPDTQNRRLRFGPFRSISDFHRFLRRGHEGSTEQNAGINELVAMHEKTWPICFTHADLSSLNILAKGDQVVGIVDWETAGWYPSYWEYATASNANPQNDFWRHEVDNFLEPKPEELAMDTLRNEYFGDITWR